MLLLLNSINKNTKEISFKLCNIGNLSIEEFKNIIKDNKKFFIGTIEYAATHIEDFFNIKITEKYKTKKQEDFELLNNFIDNQKVIVSYEDLLNNSILNKKILKRYKKEKDKQSFSNIKENEFVIPVFIADFVLEGKEDNFSLIIKIDKKLIK